MHLFTFQSSPHQPQVFRGMLQCWFALQLQKLHRQHRGAVVFAVLLSDPCKWDIS